MEIGHNIISKSNYIKLILSSRFSKSEKSIELELNCNRCSEIKMAISLYKGIKRSDNNNDNNPPFRRKWLFEKLILSSRSKWTKRTENQSVAKVVVEEGKLICNNNWKWMELDRLSPAVMPFSSLSNSVSLSIYLYVLIT